MKKVETLTVIPCYKCKEIKIVIPFDATNTAFVEGRRISYHFEGLRCTKCGVVFTNSEQLLKNVDSLQSEVLKKNRKRKK